MWNLGMTYDEEKAAYNLSREETIAHMKNVAVLALRETLAHSHAADTVTLIVARYSPVLNEVVQRYFATLPEDEP